MSLKNKLRELVAACFTGIWIETYEAQDAIEEITGMCSDEQWRMATWDIDQGLKISGSDALIEATDPLAAVRSLNGLASPDGTCLLYTSDAADE